MVRVRLGRPPAEQPIVAHDRAFAAWVGATGPARLAAESPKPTGLLDKINSNAPARWALHQRVMITHRRKC